MNQTHLVRYLSLCALGLVALALVGCDSGSGGGEGGSTASTTTGSPSTTSGNPSTTTGSPTSSSTTGTSSSGGTGIACGMGGYCAAGTTGITGSMGGYAFAYSDAQNMPPMMVGGSSATLATDGSLCISGTVGQVMMVGGMPDYTDYWGAGIGLNLNQAMGTNSPVMSDTLTGTSITVSTTAVPSCTTARIVIDQNGATPDYCAPLISGTATDISTFNTECWMPGSGDNATAPVASQALKIQFVTNTTSSCDFTDFCITGISL
jgi:hypothetical protein